MGRPGLAAALPQARPDLEAPLRRADVPVGQAPALGRARDHLGQGLDHPLVRPRRLRQAVAPAVRAEVLRIRRQRLGGLDLDAHPAARQLAQVADAGGARLYRGRHRDAGRRRWSTKIAQLGGTVRLGEPVEEVVVERGRARGVRTAAGTIPADAVISTVPTPLVSRMVPDLPADWKAALRRDPEHRRGLPGVQAEAVGDAAFLGQHRRARRADPGHHRVLEPARHRRYDRLRALLHADHEPALGMVGRGAARRGLRGDPQGQPGDRPRPTGSTAMWRGCAMPSRSARRASPP